MNILCISAKGFESPNTFLFLVKLFSTKNIMELAFILGNNPWTLMQICSWIWDQINVSYNYARRRLSSFHLGIGKLLQQEMLDVIVNFE
jgi:hypothetical protein